MPHRCGEGHPYPPQRTWSREHQGGVHRRQVQSCAAALVQEPYHLCCQRGYCLSNMYITYDLLFIEVFNYTLFCALNCASVKIFIELSPHLSNLLLLSRKQRCQNCYTSHLQSLYWWMARIIYLSRDCVVGFVKIWKQYEAKHEDNYERR